MPEGYLHLTCEQRCQIYALLQSGRSQAHIARQIGVDPSTISRELVRNTGARGYRFKQAHEKASQRRQEASDKPRKMTPDLVELIEEKLTQEQWSPDQISGRLAKDGVAFISHERIYQHVWKDKKDGGTLYLHIQKQVNNTTIEYLRAEKTVGEIGANIERQIFGHALEILAALRSVDEKDLIPDGCEPTCPILIGAAHENPMQHSPIIFQNDRLVRVKHYTNSPEQQVAFELRKETGFVLCEDEWCGIVFFAARHVLALIGNNIVSDDLELRREHGEKHIVNISYMTRFLPEFSTSVLRSGQSSRIIEKLARALCAAKFFDDKPWLGLDAKQSNLSEGRNARIESGY